SQTGESGMEYSFDEEFDRKGTHSVKWEFAQEGEDLLEFEHTDRCFGPDRVLPLWVADMDFRSPEPVVEALKERAEHGIFGYCAPTSDFYQSVVSWMERRNGWIIDPDWILLTPGVVPALNMLVRTFTRPGEKVLIQPPVYYPFYGAVENNDAQLVTNPLVLEGGGYRMDLTDLEAKCSDPQVKMAILCSPHNPVGRVWTEEELHNFGQICIENDILVVSDEIHGDLIYHEHVFTPFAKISETFAQNSIICTAPSKTFNLAGLLTSCIIIPNDELRSRFADILLDNGLFGMNTFGAVALQAAYDHGEEWLEQMFEYVEGNLEYLNAFVAEYIPQLEVIQPGGTYLVWLDCRKLQLGGMDLKRLMYDEARVYLDEGFIFGPEGEGFERINIACPRSILIEALDRIRKVINELPENN
ncbi:MAG: MalY/PatB family protein, partial [Anaerolineales bacterium]